MSTVVKLDIVDGHRATLTDRGWENVDRIATVSGLGGAGHARLAAAVDALGLAIESAHPSFPGVYLSRIEPQAETTTVVTLRLVYERPVSGRSALGEVLIETGSTLEEVETNMDIRGKVIGVTYTDPQAVVHKQGGTVSVGRPRSMTVISRGEKTNPEIKSDAYTGKVNASAWRGWPARTVRCNAITGTSRDGGKTYQVRYEFERAPTWKKTLVYRDPETGRPPDDVDWDNGMGEWEFYDTANFAALGLPTS